MKAKPLDWKGRVIMCCAKTRQGRQCRRYGREGYKSQQFCLTHYDAMFALAKAIEKQAALIVRIETRVLAQVRTGRRVEVRELRTADARLGAMVVSAKATFPGWYANGWFRGAPGALS